MMPFLLAMNKAILTPPKCGTHTVIKIMEAIGGREGVCARGHLKRSEFFPRLKSRGHSGERITFAMNVRDPVERLVSIINHQFAKRKDRNTLDEVLDHIKHAPGTLFPSQTAYTEGDSKVRLFPFEGFPIIRWLGWIGPIPHEFPGEYRWSFREIITHKPLFNLCMERYEVDYALCEKVKSHG